MEQQGEFSLSLVASVIGAYVVVNLAQLLTHIGKMRKKEVANHLIIPFKVAKCLVALLCVAHLLDLKKDLKTERLGVV